ncbi:hypothetical protein Aduo_015102 [Ancylostoma duodenale]
MISVFTAVVRRRGDEERDVVASCTFLGNESRVPGNFDCIREIRLQSSGKDISGGIEQVIASSCLEKVGVVIGMPAPYPANFPNFPSAAASSCSCLAAA